MTPAQVALIDRALHQQRSEAKTALAAADDAAAGCAAQVATISAGIARERAAADVLRQLPFVGLAFGPWHATAARHLQAAKAVLAAAEAACDDAREALAEVLRTERGMAVLAGELARKAARREAASDPLHDLLAMPRVDDGAWAAGGEGLY